MPNGIFWNRTVLKYKHVWTKSYTYTKLNCFYLFIRTVWLNWIAWNRTDYLYKNEFDVK